MDNRDYLALSNSLVKTAIHVGQIGTGERRGLTAAVVVDGQVEYRIDCVGSARKLVTQGNSQSSELCK
jgi:hypothetical protein